MGPPLEVLIAFRASKQCAYKRPDEFYMLAPGAKVDLDQLLVHWFAAYDQLQMPIELALSAFASSDLWLHMEFLTLMQCLEGFHRGLYPGLYMDEPAYADVEAKMVGAIPAEVASDHRSALKSRIRYGNEISLAKRLADLVKLMPEDLNQHILGAEGKVPQRWIDTRNYYTHWDEASRDKVVDNLELHRANLRLKHWLRALYLNHLGIPSDAILASASNAHGDSQYLLQIKGGYVGQVKVRDPAG